MPWMPWKRTVDCFDVKGRKIETVIPDATGTFTIPDGTDRFVSSTEFRRAEISSVAKKVSTRGD